LKHAILVGGIMSLLNNIIEYPDIFENIHIQKLYHNIALRTPSWGFQRSFSSDDDLMLRFSLDPDGEIVKTLFPIIVNKTKINFKIRDVYLNGQLFGMSGAPHSDHTEQNTYTFLVYVNPVWKDEWGGRTIFFDKYQIEEINPETGKSKLKDITNSGASKSFLPKANLGLMFPSKIIHYAESPTKECKLLRVTLAFKLLRVF